jgi:hypothetical protein
MKTNFWAVLVGAVVYWLMGAVWYDVLFQKPWLSLEHLSLADAAKMSPVLPYVMTLVLNILIAFALAQVCRWRNVKTAAGGALVGLILWVGFVGPITYTTNMYELRPAELFAINYFYPLAGLLVMGAIVGAWRKKPA